MIEIELVNVTDNTVFSVYTYLAKPYFESGNMLFIEACKIVYRYISEINRS